MLLRRRQWVNPEAGPSIAGLCWDARLKRVTVRVGCRAKSVMEMVFV